MTEQIQLDMTKKSWTRSPGRFDLYRLVHPETVEATLFYNKKSREYWLAVGDSTGASTTIQFYSGGKINRTSGKVNVVKRNQDRISQSEGLPKRFRKEVDSLLESISSVYDLQK